MDMEMFFGTVVQMVKATSSSLCNTWSG
jgi:hypothetical protein